MAPSSDKSPQRLRREWEDTLLHNRTAIFLVLNGFALQKPSAVVAFVGVLINCLWLLASFQSRDLIRSLVFSSLAASSTDGAQDVVNKALGNRRIHHYFRPTTIVSQWVPLIVYAAWCSYLGWVFKNALLTATSVTSGSAFGIAAIVFAGLLGVPFLILAQLRRLRAEKALPDQITAP